MATKWLSLLASTLLFCSCAAPSAHLQHATPPATAADDLRRTIGKLAGEVGERNIWHSEKLADAANWIEAELTRAGYKARRQEFSVAKTNQGSASNLVWNIEAELRGTSRPEEILIIGAHYDSKAATSYWHAHGPTTPEKPGTPGANDNASGVAAMLALAKFFEGHPQRRTIRFVAFVNEEPPFYQTPKMGSWVYAQASKMRDEKIVGMISAETLGCYSVRPRHKRNLFFRLFAPLFGLPDRPDYVAFVGNFNSRVLVREAKEAFRNQVDFPVRSVAVPTLHRRVAWSDDWAFWKYGFRAFSVTDTAYLRHDDYHELDDTPEKIDYEQMSRVVEGLKGVIRKLAN